MTPTMATIARLRARLHTGIDAGSPLRPVLSQARRGVRAVAAAPPVAWPLDHRRAAPDYLIVGAQRCGTTSLHRYLVEHPAVVPPRFGYKGVHYFDTAFTRGPRWYRAHFPTHGAMARTRARTGARPVVGEASPYYMFHPLALRRIAEMLPRVKLIVLLRDPVDRAHSHYEHMVLEGLEDAPSFEEAVAREPARLAGEVDRLLEDPAYVSPAHQHHAYLARGEYADQVARLFELFPRAQVLVVSSERFFAEPAVELQRVTDFLGIEPFDRPPPPRRHNAGAYERMAPATRAALEAHFALSDARLRTLLGWSPYRAGRPSPGSSPGLGPDGRVPGGTGAVVLTPLETRYGDGAEAR